MAGPSFRFRLERLRSIRQHGEDAAKQALAGALSDHARCEARVQSADEQLAAARAAHLEATETPMSAADLMARQAFLEQAESTQHHTRAQLASSEEAVAGKQVELTQATQRRQALDSLRERKLADHNREQERREGMVLDEIALASHVRRAV